MQRLRWCVRSRDDRTRTLLWPFTTKVILPSDWKVKSSVRRCQRYWLVGTRNVLKHILCMPELTGTIQDAHAKQLINTFVDCVSIDYADANESCAQQSTRVGRAD